MPNQEMRLWDLPTRIFHWALVLTVGAAIVSGEVGGRWIDLHGRLGLAILGLLVFRLVWGVLGSTYARFAQFFPTPARIGAYLRGQWQGEGHNPLGALSVFALLGLLLLQVSTGLFANDDIAFRGPLAVFVSDEISHGLSELHEAGAELLLPLLGLHVAAIVFYLRVRRNNLLRPMITGRKPGDPARSARGGGPLALLLALLVAGAAVYGASGAWQTPPPPPVAAPTPGW